MIIVMEKNTEASKTEAVVAELVGRGFDVHRSTGSDQTVLGVVGNVAAIDPREFELLDGVQEVVRVSEPFKLASRTFKRETTVVELSSCKVGGRDVVVMAGPCTIENERQLFETARSVARAGAKVLRGGAYKPRTSPYAFQGLGVEGLKMLAAAGREFGMATVSEVMEISQIEAMLEYVDVLQIGARNMQNVALLRAAARTGKPILLKRGPAATLDELLAAAEYILMEGNAQVVLCERGLRGFDRHTRNLFDLAGALRLRELTHLPVIVDPSHATGRRSLVVPMALAAAAAGLDGAILEVHPQPEEALSDAEQALAPEEFAAFTRRLDALREAVKEPLLAGR